MNASKTTGLAYDATAILGFGPLRDAPLPYAAAGEIVIRYGGWSLQELRDNPIVRKHDLMWDQDWYDKYAWANDKLPADTYRLRIPVPGSCRKAFAAQVLWLPSGDQPAPVVLVATALLAYRVQTGLDLLKGNYTRCKEPTADDGRVVLYWNGGRLSVNDDWEVYAYGHVGLSSVRSIS